MMDRGDQQHFMEPAIIAMGSMHGGVAWTSENAAQFLCQRGRASLIKLKKQSVEKEKKLCALIFNYDILWN